MQKGLILFLLLPFNFLLAGTYYDDLSDFLAKNPYASNDQIDLMYHLGQIGGVRHRSFRYHQIIGYSATQAVNDIPPLKKVRKRARTI